MNSAKVIGPARWMRSDRRSTRGVLGSGARDPIDAAGSGRAGATRTLCHHSSVETANHGAGGPATPRRAATVVVVRSVDGGGVEVLVLRRSRSSRFAPGFVVFPGGAVDDGDRELARRWFGSPTELDRACAVRELREEAGLVLGSDGIITAPGG